MNAAGWPPADHTSLDRYLNVVFALIEGGSDVADARELLSEYLADPAQPLPPEATTMLIQLFFAKCAREFAPDQEL